MAVLSVELNGAPWGMETFMTMHRLVPATVVTEPVMTGSPASSRPLQLVSWYTTWPNERPLGAVVDAKENVTWPAVPGVKVWA